MNGKVLPEIRPLLNLLVENSPRLFYKPVFALAGAMKDFTLVGQLANVVTMAKHIPQFWIKNSEMIAIALMSDSSSQPKTKPNEQSSWGKIRLGQSFILVELILYVRELRKNKENSGHVRVSYTDLLNLIFLFFSILRSFNRRLSVLSLV